tara:strand:- start:1964 stop:2230 length:267 start_codon:yes stop_codon:yes gene_type:complete
MKTREMMELIQQHHPHMGEQEIINLLNRAKDEFCERTDIYKKTDSSLSTTAGTRWYTIPAGLVKIEKIFLNDVQIPRLQGNPVVTDET